jgi:hypothetical protein
MRHLRKESEDWFMFYYGFHYLGQLLQPGVNAQVPDWYLRD